MHYLFSNIKFLLLKEDRTEEDFYAGLGLDHDTLFHLVTGTSYPSPEQLLLIADTLGYSIDDLIRKNLSAMVAETHAVRMMVADVDGVMTDGGMLYTDSGLEIKKYNAKDGLAMMRMEKNGIRTGMLSHGFNQALIRSRAEMLGVSFFYTGQEEKLTVMKEWSGKAGIPLEQMAYIGDDLNDLDVIRKVGFTAAPSDAAGMVRKEVNLVLKAKGGEGCVRELAEWLFPQFFK